MEYCDRGTIEDAAKLGLPEHMIRKYTRDILVAIHTLHEHGIVHRDIKGKLNIDDRDIKGKQNIDNRDIKGKLDTDDRDTKGKLTIDDIYQR